MGWWMVAYWVATLILSEVLRPKVNVTDAAATNAEDAGMPVVSATKPIPVIWGRVRLSNPDLTWYGDYYARPIKKAAGKGGFLGTGRTIWQTVGYRYYWGQQLALCHGPVKLHRIWSEEREIWAGTSTGGDVIVDNEGLYGGEDSGGGLAAKISFIPGTQTQNADPYLLKMLGSVPAYRGVASCVWCGPSSSMPDNSHPPLSWIKQSGYIGTSPVPRAMSFELSRYPANLVAGKAVIGMECNPAELIYECLTTDPNGPDGWGMGLSAALIDTASFIAAANKFYDEGFGLSMIWDAQTPVEDTIAEVCRVVDAVCYRDFRSGLYTLKLIRGGYSADTLPVLDETNILEMENFSQAGLDGTTNSVTVNYTDRSQNYKKLNAQAQDLANMRMQSDVVAASFNFLSVMDATLADRLANRELFAGSNPIAKVDATVNRQAYPYGPGDLFVVKWAALGINSIVMRVQKTAVGLPKANRIRLSLVQDVFNLGSASYQVAGGTSWVDPIVNPAPVTLQSAVELPYYFNNDLNNASYMVCAQRPNSGCVTFEVWEKLNSVADYTYRDTCQTFTPTTVLSSPYQSKPGVDAAGLTVLGNLDINSISGATDTDIRSGANLAVFETGEIFAFTGILDNGNGTTTLTGIWGGLLDTVPSYHGAGERIWFFTYGASNPEDKVGQSDTINIKNLPYGPRGSIALAQATAMNLTLSGRNLKPYPPGKMQVNSITAPSSIVGTAQATWALRNKKLQTSIVRQDDDSVASSEGYYNADVYIGGVLRRSYTQLPSGELGAISSAGPNFSYGLCNRSDGSFFISSTYSILGSDSGGGPHAIFQVSPTGYTLFHGSGAGGFVNGAPTAARYHWPTQMVVDSANNIYVIDQAGTKIRRILASNVVETYCDLTPAFPPAGGVGYDNANSIDIDSSGNLLVFMASARCIVKITPARVITVVAGNRYGDPETEVDGTGTSAFFKMSNQLACDAAGNCFVWSTSGKVRYCTSAGAVTTLIQLSQFYVGNQQAVVGSDFYFGDASGSYVHKLTPAGAHSIFATHPDGFFFYALREDLSAGGHLIYIAYPTGIASSGIVEYGTISSSGTVTKLYRGMQVKGYSPALRIADDTNGGKLVEIKVQQALGDNASQKSLYNSTGQFQMTGFGMCFGQTFGGIQQ